ncbi:MAG TPA: NAD(P)-dependent oxidoreductase [Candidatus Nitrosotalea sp.]|nr:NAD(P)-dependent oxidoreductase [Candidatus Nitrosotalea sp.]
MADLGFVGLGTMGAPIVRRLLASGHRVVGYNRNAERARALIEAGMGWAATPGQAAAAADITFTMVTDASALEAVCSGPDGILAGLRPGSILADISTVGPEAIEALAPRLVERGCELVDAPISGSPSAVDQGRASFMIGGSEPAVARVTPILEGLGSGVTYVGPVGCGALMKLACNIQVAVPFMALAEALVLAEKGGISRQSALEVLLKSATMSPALAFRAPFTLASPRPAPFAVEMMEKDLGLILNYGRQLAVPLPTTAATAQMLSAAHAVGLADEDFSAIFGVLARLAGIEDQA